ncbi:MAG TPA: hypothetical protein VGJ25_10045 [Gaiellaceae bacterium]
MSPDPSSEQPPTAEPEQPAAEPTTEEPQTDEQGGEGEAEEEAGAEASGKRASPRKRGKRKPAAEPEPVDEPAAADDSVPAGFANCPVCYGHGVVPLGLERSPDTDACPTCKGHGLVASGSLVPEHALIPCTACHGNGYLVRELAPEPYVAPELPTPLPPPLVPSPTGPAAPLDYGQPAPLTEHPRTPLPVPR